VSSAEGRYAGIVMAPCGSLSERESRALDNRWGESKIAAAVVQDTGHVDGEIRRGQKELVIGGRERSQDSKPE